MRSKTIDRRSFIGGTASLAVSSWRAASAAAKPHVVATFSILGDFVRNVGGEHIDLAVLVGANSDAHVYVPTPVDAKELATSEVVFINGMGFEGWIRRLIEASGTRARVVVATDGIEARQDPQGAGAGIIDPHAWQSVANAKIYVANIRRALSATNPDADRAYTANAARYIDELDALDRDIRAQVLKIPPSRRKIITTHDAFGYFQGAYGIEFLAPEGVSTEAEPSANDVAAIISHIRSQQIPAVFLENVSDPRLLQRIAQETGARVGGTLYSDALTPAGSEAPTYVAMMRHNIAVLAAALTS